MKTLKNKIIYEKNFGDFPAKALTIVFPENLQEIKTLVKASNKDIIVRGAGSSLTGAVVPKNSVIIDCSKMNKIIDINEVRKTAIVEPGVLISELNEELDQYGLEFPIIPFSGGIETLGGMIAKNSVGSREIRYGRMNNWIDSVEIINSKGEQIKVPKSDLSDIVGMEGTTGIIIKANIRLTTKKNRSLTILKTEKLADVIAVNQKLRLDLDLCSLELFNPTVSSLLGFERKYHLFAEYESNKGFFKGEDYLKYNKLKNKAYKKLATEGLYLIENIKLSSDSLMDFLIYLEENRIPYFGHIASGVIYSCFRPEQLLKIEEMLRLAKKLRAKIGYNFGVGIKNKEYLEIGEVDLIKRIKRRQDPECKFGKGKLMDYKEKEILTEDSSSNLEEDNKEADSEKQEINQEVIDEIVENQIQGKPIAKEELSPEERDKVRKIASGFFAGGKNGN